MRTIALTGHPQAQDAAQMQLLALINGRGLPITVLVGLLTTAEAHGVHVDGGEVWHCGLAEPKRELMGLVDRHLPASTFEGMGLRVASALAQFLAKTQVAA